MNYSEEKSIIESHFEANWGHTPIVFENGVSMEDDEWVRISILNGDAFQASLGDNPVIRHIGIVVVSIFTKKDEGSGRALQLADLVDSIFRLATISGIVFRVPQIKKIGGVDWYQVNVSTEFFRGS